MQNTVAMTVCHLQYTHVKLTLASANFFSIVIRYKLHSLEISVILVAEHCGEVAVVYQQTKTSSADLARQILKTGTLNPQEKKLSDALLL
jgi:hypothetical protein